MIVRTLIMYISMYFVEVQRRFPFNAFHVLRANHLNEVRVLCHIFLFIVTELVRQFFDRILGGWRNL